MNDPKPNLILIGLRASGKSTFGRRLADALGRAFVDLDDASAAVLDTTGAGEAIERHGIDAFRNAEAQALGTALQAADQVIALGGGTPTAPSCADMLEAAQHAKASRVIYLRALPETLRDRLAQADNTNRPPLVGGDVLDEVQTLFDQRDGLYRKLAESVIHTDGVSEDSVMAGLVAIAKADL
tara:strand:- start:134613 stop:135161 length:549 start_codon:yes stop_codon:yes gene_type:complete